MRKLKDRAAGQKGSRLPGYEWLSDEHATYLKKLVFRARMADLGLKVFGASTHRYHIKPVISIEKVREFEEKHQLLLPKEYVFFLTKVGNGGAGPDYGIEPLEKLEAYHKFFEISGKPAWINADLTPAMWSERMNDLEELNDDLEYDRSMNEICAGLLVIGTQGCTYDNLLMLSGSEQGRMVVIDWNLEPDRGPYLTGLSFLDWYERFFLEIIGGTGQFAKKN